MCCHCLIIDQIPVSLPRKRFSDLYLYFLIIGFWFMTTVICTQSKSRTRRRQILTIAGVGGILLLWANMLAFGVSPVLEVDWFSSLDRTWGPSIAVDQQNAGTSVLLIGVAPLAGVLATFLSYKSRPTSSDATDTNRSLPDVSR